METILRYVIIAAVGALASILANQSIAVFNDGLRPVLPEYLEKRMDRKALAATSFAIGFGLVIGYGLPTSIAAKHGFRKCEACEGGFAGKPHHALRTDSVW